MIWRCFYCEGDHARCRRLALATAGEPVPENMLPNGRLLNHDLDRQPA